MDIEAKLFQHPGGTHEPLKAQYILPTLYPAEEL